MKRRDGMLAVEKKKLPRLVSQFVLSIGGRVVEGVSGAFALDTPLGGLRVHPYGDWIACCFLEPKRAAALALRIGGITADTTLFGIPLNTWSGKWNHHFFARVTAAEAVGSFRRVVEQLLATEV